MSPITTIFTILVSSAALISATQMTTHSGQGCNSGTAVVFTGHEEACLQLNNVQSLQLDNLDGGCTATIYADNSCSSNPEALRVGQCLSTNGNIRSFSWDC